METYLSALSKILVILAIIWCFWAGYKIYTTLITYEVVELSDSAYDTGSDAETETRRFDKISHFGVGPLSVPALISLIALCVDA